MEAASFYLGPAHESVPLRTWDEVRVAAASGVLDETHWVELKLDVPASSRSANLELARDLASLSVDGGLLIVGIADAGGVAGEVVGADLASLGTRIAQVAAGTISPSLTVVTTKIDHPEDSNRGVLLVTVPASLDAPHMVDERYWGRSDTGKRRLSDPEVRRLLEERQRRSAGFAERVHALTERFDLPEAPTTTGHVHVVAEPRTVGLGAALSEAVGDEHPLTLVMQALDFAPNYLGITSAGTRLPHADGVGATTQRVRGTDEEDVQFLLADTGAVWLTAGGAVFEREGTPGRWVAAAQVMEAAHCTARLSGYVGATRLGYHGQWQLGVLVTRLQGALAVEAGHVRSPGGFVPFPMPDYYNATKATTSELLHGTSSVVARLLQPLLRGLNVTNTYLPYESGAEISRHRAR